MRAWWKSLTFLCLMLLPLALREPTARRRELRPRDPGGRHGPIPQDWQVGAAAARSALPVPAGASFHWRDLGPVQMANYIGVHTQGRVTALWLDPEQEGRWLAGFNGGGLWLTHDGGASWRPLTDHELSVSVASIAVDPSNRDVIFVGTGDANFQPHPRYPMTGVGILRSVDGGRHFTRSPVAYPASVPVQDRAVGRIAVDPRDPAVVYAAASGGLLRSTDGGESWGFVRGGGLPYTGDPANCSSDLPIYATDLLLDDTGGSLVIYVAIGNPFGSPLCANDFEGRARNGIYRSTDDGASWTRIATMGEGDFLPLAPCSGFGRITLLKAATRTPVYALIHRPGREAACAGIRRHRNLGLFRALSPTDPVPSWELRSVVSCREDECYGMHAGAVDPGDADVVYLGGVQATRSLDGGQTFAPIGNAAFEQQAGVPYLHGDTRAGASVRAGSFVAGTDGGVFLATDRGAAMAVEPRNGPPLSTFQLYSLAQHPTRAFALHAGTQDGGQIVTDDGVHWREASYLGDGFASLTNQDHPSITYAEYYFGLIFQSTDGGHDYDTANGWLRNFGDCADDVVCVPDDASEAAMPMVLDPSNQDVLLAGSRFLYSIVAPSPANRTWTRHCAPAAGDECGDFTSGAPIEPQGERELVVQVPPEAISAIHVAGAGGRGCNGNLTSCDWIVGSSAGALFRSVDGGQSFARIDQIEAGATPNRRVNAVVTDAEDAARLVVGYGGFDETAARAGRRTGHLFRSLDGGTRWADIGGGLPDVPIEAIAADPRDGGSLYLGTWMGVYRVRDWQGPAPTVENVSANLPNTAVTSLAFSPANGRLRAATFGRGAWELETQPAPPR